MSKPTIDDALNLIIEVSHDLPAGEMAAKLRSSVVFIKRNLCRHDSDCAVHNMPALPNNQCTCEVTP